MRSLHAEKEPDGQKTATLADALMALNFVPRDFVPNHLCQLIVDYQASDLMPHSVKASSENGPMIVQAANAKKLCMVDVVAQKTCLPQRQNAFPHVFHLFRYHIQQ